MGVQKYHAPNFVGDAVDCTKAVCNEKPVEVAVYIHSLFLVGVIIHILYNEQTDIVRTINKVAVLQQHCGQYL